MRNYGFVAAGRLKYMVDIYNAMVKALLAEDRDALRNLRQKARALKRELKLTKENEVQPSLASMPRDLADRGQLIFRISESSLSICDCLMTAVKACFRHIDNNHTGLNQEQGDALLELMGNIGRLCPRLIVMLKAGDDEGINGMLAKADQISGEFAKLITCHLKNNATDESSLRIGILYLTLLNETRDMVSRAFALIRCIRCA